MRFEVLRHELQHAAALAVGMRVHRVDWNDIAANRMTLHSRPDGAELLIDHHVTPRARELNILGASILAPAYCSVSEQSRRAYLADGQLDHLDAPDCAHDLSIAEALEPRPWFVARVGELTRGLPVGGRFNLLRALEGQRVRVVDALGEELLGRIDLAIRSELSRI